MATPVNTSGLMPANPGIKQTFTVYGFTPGLTYYFAIRTRDEANNWSPVSNVAAFTGSAVNIGPDVPIEMVFLEPVAESGARIDAVPVESPGGTRGCASRRSDVSGRRVSTIAMGQYSAARST